MPPQHGALAERLRGGAHVQDPGIRGAGERLAAAAYGALGGESPTGPIWLSYIRTDVTR